MSSADPSIASLVKPSIAFTHTEMEFLQKISASSGLNPSLPIYLICELFNYSTALKIESIVRNLKPLQMGTKAQIAESRSSLLKFKAWSTKHKFDLCSDATISNFALLSAVITSVPKKYFVPPFFHSVDLVRKRGLVRFQNYSKNEDLPYFLSHISPKVKDDLLPLIEDMKHSSLLYSKVALSSKDATNLLKPVNALVNVTAWPKAIISPQQIQTFLKFVVDFMRTAQEEHHVNLQIQVSERLLSLAAIDHSYTKEEAERVEKELYVCMLYLFKQAAIFKNQFADAMIGTLTYEAFTAKHGMAPRADYTQDIFCSELNQFGLHLSNLGLMLKDLLVHFQPFVASNFFNAGEEGSRYTYHPEAIRFMQEATGYFKLMKEQMPLFILPEPLRPLFPKKELEALLVIFAEIEQFLHYHEYTSFNPFYEEINRFCEKLKTHDASYHDIISFKILQEQLENQIGLYYKDFQALAVNLEALVAHFETKLVTIEEKDSICAYLSFIQLSLANFQKMQTWLLQASHMLFRDHIFEEKPIEISYSFAFADYDWEKIIKIIPEKTVEEAAPLAEVKVEHEEALAEASPKRAPSPKAQAFAAGGGAAALEEAPSAHADLPTRGVSSRKVLHILEDMGFEVIRTSGSHAILRHVENKKTVTLPQGYDNMAQGTLHSIWKQAGAK